MVVMTRLGIVEKPLSSKQATEDAEQWGSIFQIADETEEVTKILVDLVKSYDIKGKNIHDTNIVATMMVNQIPTLFTLNTDDFKKFKKIQLITI